jgi:flavin reductase (DIM6/NTAB) family NADH-FMN oxidoreductase RutF
LIRKVPSKAERYFATGLSLITSRDTNGPNIMSAEWVMQVSYDPILISVFIHRDTQTLRNIQRTKEFGVNVASKEQTTQISIAGGYSGTEIDKIKIKDIFTTIRPRKIKTPLISGCTINAECRLVKTEKLGDHVMVIGKVVHIRHDDTKSPLIYHKGRYFGLNSTIEPHRKEIKVSKRMLEFFKQLAQGKFVLKSVGVMIKSKNKILVVRCPMTTIETIPFSNPPAGINQRAYLIEFLNQMELKIRVSERPIMRRIVLKNRKDIQRVNFVLFAGKSREPLKNMSWMSISEDELISALVSIKN